MIVVHFVSDNRIKFKIIFAQFRNKGSVNKLTSRWLLWLFLIGDWLFLIGDWLFLIGDWLFLIGDWLFINVS